MEEAPALLALTPQNSLQTKHKVSNQVSRNAECGMAKWRRHEWRRGGDMVATWQEAGIPGLGQDDMATSGGTETGIRTFVVISLPFV